ncbi:MAG: ABC-F family ATP-binding cassette domain-containing protein [Candidatus Riflebacteria bacterium]|nr:ABC-F family ATP-binding cassette domain-containing protein [Candidatus Riflebacteria bacterium]
MLQFIDVSFSYDSSPQVLFDSLNFHLSKGWTGIVAPNGAGKTTILQLAAGILIPDSGTVKSTGTVGYVPQKTDFEPDNISSLFNPEFLDSGIFQMSGMLEIQSDWMERWNTLSHGERKRIQIACAIIQSPDILLVDEPTNHLDINSSSLVIKALEKFRGCGLIVSHDRNLLDQICCRIMFVESLSAEVFSGNYSEAALQKEMILNALRNRQQKAKNEVRRLESELKRRRQEAQRSVGRLSKKNLDKNDSDGRGKINLAKLTGKDAVAGNLAVAFATRVVRAKQELDSIKIKKEYDLAFNLIGEKSQKDLLARIPACRIPLSPEREITLPDFTLFPDDRIGIIGPNGSGKSTFLNYLISHIEIPPNRLIYLPQEISECKAVEILEEFQRLPSKELGEVCSYISCLGSVPERLLNTKMPSPGELRKIQFAIGLTRRPWLIIMDEPTNHLDLHAVELLEKALEKIESAIVLVSHDLKFIEKLTTRRMLFNF